jgi:DNA polymerase III psi subunit
MQNYISQDTGISIPLYTWSDKLFPTDRLKGNNTRGVLVLARSEDIPQHLLLLKKILRSVSCDFDKDIAFATIQEGEEYAMLADEKFMQNSICLIFGIPLRAVGIAVEIQSNLLEFDGLTIIRAPALSELESSPESKRELWSYLKRTFDTS